MQRNSDSNKYLIDICILVVEKMGFWFELTHAICAGVGYITSLFIVNTLRPRQNRCHFPGDIFKYIFLNENVWIVIQVSQKFVPKGPIKNIPALDQIMAWRRPGNKPLFEAMIAS